MKIVDLLTLIALVLGPVSSVLVARTIQQRAFLRAQRLDVFTSLMVTRAQVFSPERLKALAVIDVVYLKYPRVRKKWAEYYEALSNPAHNNPNGALARLMKFNDLLAEMARSLGYGSEIGFEEITRVYNPQGVIDTSQTQEQVLAELLRVLQASESFGVARRADITRLPAVKEA